MEDRTAEEKIEFQIGTLRRRQDHLIGKIEKSANARRFNLWEIEALKSAIPALQKTARFEEVAEILVSLVTSLETGSSDELAQVVDEAKDVIDKYNL